MPPASPRRTPPFMGDPHCELYRGCGLRMVHDQAIDRWVVTLYFPDSEAPYPLRFADPLEALEQARAVIDLELSVTTALDRALFATGFLPGAGDPRALEDF